jgi:hypothetical protein
MSTEHFFIKQRTAPLGILQISDSTTHKWNSYMVFINAIKLSGKVS